MLKDHNLAELSPKLVDRKVALAGFVHSIRKHGQVIFIDLRDVSGIAQIVFDSKDKLLYRRAKNLAVEYVILVKGRVKKRPKELINKKIVSGEVEVKAEELEVLSVAKTPPFEIGQDTRGISEEKRLANRYIDLRSQRMLNNLKIRAKITRYIRDFLFQQGFIEIETPYLTKGTPEGAREYLVPARLHPERFYVLPQSPQQFKQLLMVSGIERYFQIVRCFRDEDPRADRQQEFTQLDMELAYVSQEDIITIVEELLSEMVEDLFPEKKITKLPFPRFSYQTALKQFQTDSPNIKENPRDPNELGFCWVTDFPLLEYNSQERKLVSTHHPFTKPKEEDIKLLDSKPEKVRAQAYDLVLNGTEIGGGSIRINDHRLQEKIFQILGLSKEEIRSKFGHLLKAFQYGVPPHGGIAPGLDRIVMELANEKNIREVIAFPKTGDGRDLMMRAPDKVDPNQLKELNIAVKKDS